MLFAQQNTVKTANQDSIINFYFVTGFYYLNNICMVDIRTCFKARRLVYLGKKGLKQKNSDKNEKTFKNIWRFKEKAIPLHSLLRTKLFNKERMVLEAQHGGRSSVG